MTQSRAASKWKGLPQNGDETRDYEAKPDLAYACRRGPQIAHAFIGDNFDGQMSVCGKVSEQYLSTPQNTDRRCKRCEKMLTQRSKR